LGLKAVPIINKEMLVPGDKSHGLHQTLYADHCYCLLMAVCFLTRVVSSNVNCCLLLGVINGGAIGGFK
jgi:hypothetical protein